METEILTLIELKVFDVMETEPHMKVLSGVWALRCKGYLEGLVSKLKARHCAQGFKQIKGVDYFETHSPVVMWLSV